MDIQLITGLLIGFLGSEIGRKLVVYLWGKLGNYVDSTENETDDTIYEITPNFLDMLTDHLDFGQAEKVLDDILKDLKEADEDTTELETEVEKRKEDIKKQQ